MNISEKACVNTVRVGQNVVFGLLTYGATILMGNSVLPTKDEMVSNQKTVIQHYKLEAFKNNGFIKMNAVSANQPKNAHPVPIRLPAKTVLDFEENKLKTLIKQDDPNTYARHMFEKVGIGMGILFFSFGLLQTLANRTEDQAFDGLGKKLHKKLNS